MEQELVASRNHGDQAAKRVWRFADCEFDERTRRLWVRGKAVELQARPTEVLFVLLCARDHTLTRDQILGRVWGGDADDASLRVAVNRLRDVLEHPAASETADRETIIQTIPRTGYRIAVPVQQRLVAEAFSPDRGLGVGDLVPGYEDWKLAQPLDPLAPHRVWLAEHRTTGEVQVFKFAADEARLQALQCEKTVFRALKESLRETGAFVRILNWRFTSKPYFLQMEYGGLNLIEWAERQRAEGGLARETCLDLMADLADAVAAAHDLGIIHSDLKPTNILVSPSDAGPGRFRVKVADFGVARLSDPGRIAALDITVQGFSADGVAAHPAGTALYLAPEVGPGRLPTARADVYALGVILFQLLCGDFRETPTPGWERRINDPLLEDDIATSANLDPAKRFSSAAELARNLRALPGRRAEAERLETERRAHAEALAEARRRSEAMERQMDRSNARRPWMVAAIVVLALGLCTSLWFYAQARQQQGITARVNDFLNNNVLGQANPASGNPAGETLREAVLQSAAAIDGAFAGHPAIAAQLHYTVANALNAQSAFADAGREFDAAAARWTEAEGAPSARSLSAQFEHVTMLAKSMEPGSLDQARTLFAQQDALYNRLARPRDGLQAVRLMAKGTIELSAADPRAALADFQRADSLAAGDPHLAEPLRLSIAQRLCVVELKAGEAAQSEACDRQLIALLRARFGPGANVNLPEVALAQALLLEAKDQEAIREATAIYPQLVQSLGPENNATLQVLATRAAAEGTLELWDRSIADDLTVAAAAARHYPHGILAVGSLADAALSECRNGRVDAGEAHARQALAAADTPGINAGIRGGITQTVVTCMLAHWQNGLPAGRLDDAQHLLAQINVPAVSALTANPEWGANVQLYQAIIAADRKQFPEATALLNKIRPAFTGPTADPYPKAQMEALSALLQRREVAAR